MDTEDTKHLRNPVVYLDKILTISALVLIFELTFKATNFAYGVPRF